MFKSFTLCLLAALALVACGVKPKALKAPEGSTATYPRSYPAPDAQQ